MKVSCGRGTSISLGLNICSWAHQATAEAQSSVLRLRLQRPRHTSLAQNLESFRVYFCLLSVSRSGQLASPIASMIT